LFCFVVPQFRHQRETEPWVVRDIRLDSWDMRFGSLGAAGRRLRSTMENQRDAEVFVADRTVVPLSPFWSGADSLGFDPLDT